MPSHFYAPTKEDKFAFGIWCLQNRGRDPFGDVTRPELSATECIRGLAQRNCYGFEFHDNDIIPFGAAAQERDRIIKELKKALSDWRRQISSFTPSSKTVPSPAPIRRFEPLPRKR